MIRINHDLVPFLDENDKQVTSPITGRLLKKAITYHQTYRILKKKNPNFDEFSFIDVNDAVPSEFDLVDLKFDSGRMRTGWWAGTEFACRRKREDEHVVAWRRRHVEDEMSAPFSPWKSE